MASDNMSWLQTSLQVYIASNVFWKHLFNQKGAAKILTRETLLKGAVT